MSNCYVSGGDCYCDLHCVFYNDCCEDVQIPIFLGSSSDSSYTQPMPQTHISAQL